MTLPEPSSDQGRDSAPDPAPDPAIARYWMLQLMRLGGLLLVIGGVLILSGRVEGPEALGYGLLVLGAFEFFALPWMLARRWRSPRP